MSRSSVIPEISDVELCQLALRIRPVVQASEGLFNIKPPNDLRKIAFTWDPTLTDLAEDLEPLVEIPTFHIYGYVGFFKPSVAEIIAQIPVGFLDQVVAFSTTGPQTSTELNAQRAVIEKGFHLAKTQLYKRKA